MKAENKQSKIGQLIGSGTSVDVYCGPLPGVVRKVGHSPIDDRRANVARFHATKSLNLRRIRSRIKKLPPSQQAIANKRLARYEELLTQHKAEVDSQQTQNTGPIRSVQALFKKLIDF